MSTARGCTVYGEVFEDGYVMEIRLCVLVMFHQYFVCILPPCLLRDPLLTIIVGVLFSVFLGGFVVVAVVFVSLLLLLLLCVCVRACVRARLRA